MQLSINTIKDCVLENDDENNDEEYTQFTLIEIFGIYLIVHNYQKNGKIFQDLFAYDDLEEAKECLRHNGIPTDF